jgi:hypothetical protein
MAFLETTNTLRKRVVSGVCPIPVVLGGTVQEGDTLGYNSGWINSVSATTYQPLLVAGEAGASGDTITAYPIALVSVTHTAANTPADGDLIAVADTGYYAAVGSGLPDVGFCNWVAGDSLTSLHLVIPSLPQIDTARA